MKLNFLSLVVAASAALSLANGSYGATATIAGLDIRGTGIFGFQPGDPFATAHTDNILSSTLNGGAFPGGARTAADPIDVEITYSNLDLDDDLTANDEVTFTVRWTKVDFDEDGLDGGALASFGQGMDTGFGNLNDLQVSVLNVSGTTTDTGDSIVFDGFTRVTLGAGGNVGGIDRTAEVNGTTIAFTEPDVGGFQFFTEFVEFGSPEKIVQIDNSGDSDFDGQGDGGTGSIVARSYHLQFSTIAPGAGDADLDGDVDGADFLAFQRDDPSGIPTWQSAYPSAPAVITAVPEPSSLALLAISTLGVLRRRR